MKHVPLLPACRGRHVTAIVIAPDGSVYAGSNGVVKPQQECPRKKAGYGRGEGWRLCRTVCGQPYHAEESALRAAGKSAKGATLYLIGHEKVCEDCCELLEAAGVLRVVIVGLGN